MSLDKIQQNPEVYFGKDSYDSYVPKIDFELTILSDFTSIDKTLPLRNPLGGTSLNQF